MSTHPRNARRLTASHWGPGLVTVSNGRLVSVGPHPDDPDPSRINENIAASLNGSARVLRPAVRESYLKQGPRVRQGERGREGFIEVTWDRALDLIHKELDRVRGRYGNEAIFAGTYGWSSAGRMHHAQSQLKRFLNTIGGFVRSEGNYSYNAALVLMPHIVKNFRDHVKETTRLSTVAQEGELMVMFGGIPLRNAQVTDGGVGRHQVRGDLLACADAGVDFVNLSPLRGDADRRLNAEWLPPRPGSDTAVMMGLAHTLLSEGLHDRPFLERYTVGFERVADYLMGRLDGQAKTADWAADMSGLDADRLRRLARQMAAKRTMICTAFGLQRADFGEQVLWMTVTLAALLGQIGLPGGGYAIGYGGNAVIGSADRPRRWANFSQGRNPVDDFIPVAMTSEMLLNPGALYDYNGQRRRFPDIRLLWWAGGNPFHHHQDLNRLRRAFQKPETVIVNEINWTATARHADIVLPVAAPQERDDFGGGQQDSSLVPMPKVVEPAGQARCEYDIYCALEAKMGLKQAFSEGLTKEECLQRLWSRMQEGLADLGQPLPELDVFLAGDMIHFEDPTPDAVFLSDFRADPDAHPLPTPSGRIELASDVIASFDYWDCPGHPVWLPPRDWTSGKVTRYPLHLLTGQPETRLHSQHDNGPFSISRKVKGREPILINPEDAAERGIGNGQVVEVFNDHGCCLAGAVVSAEILKGVLFLWTGAWYDPDFDHPEQRDRHGNPNVLTHDLRTSRLAQGPAAQSSFVELRPLSGSAPPVRAFESPVCGRET